MTDQELREALREITEPGTQPDHEGAMTFEEKAKEAIIMVCRDATPAHLRPMQDNLSARQRETIEKMIERYL